MSDEASECSASITVETLCGEPTIVSQNSVSANFRPLANVLRGARLSVVRGLVENVRQHGNDVVQPISEPAASTLGRFAAAVPVIGPSRVIHGVKLQFGNGQDAMPPTAGYEWQLEVADGLPPRLHLTTAGLDLLAVSADQRDRAVYGPLDMYSRVAQLADVVRMWENVNHAQAGYAEQGTFVLRIPVDGEHEALRVIHYAERFVETPAGPRIRGLFEDITCSAAITATRLALLDATVGRQVLVEAGAYGAIIDHRVIHAPTVLRWLTPWVPGIGHGVSTGQMPGFHPDEYARFPEMVERSAHGPVRDSVRVRRAGGGWMRMRFTASHIDPIAAPTIAVAIIVPDQSQD
jgi:hypothetical protein